MTSKNGFFHLPGFLSREEQLLLVNKAREICAEAPLRRPSMPDGTPFNLTLTNAGEIGWWSDKDGYRYTDRHPTTGHLWPPIPFPIIGLAHRALKTAGLDLMRIDSLLINHYGPDESLGLHIDRTEEDFNAPIVSFSVGAEALFLMSGEFKQMHTDEYLLQPGDACIQAPPSRWWYHGIKKIYPTIGNPLKDGGRLNFTIRKVKLP